MLPLPFERTDNRMKVFKKIDIFVFKAYFLLFLGTFFICLFVFIMQFMWRWIDDLIGKGLTLDILARFFYYSSLTLVPTALPLAILLASLITFGNLGERFELLAMKAAGIPLTRILQPVFLFSVAICIGSFYFQNVTGPDATKKFYTLAFSMQQKSPELEIPEGIFYSEIPGFNIFVEEKDKKTGMLYGVMIYSNTEGYEDAQIVLADSARIQTSADKKHLVLTLHSGERFRNMQSQGGMMKRTNVPYMRETFVKEVDLIPFDANFNMMDASLLSGNAQTKSMKDIEIGLDSLAHRSDSIGRTLFATTRRTTYKADLTYTSSEDSARLATKATTMQTNLDSVFFNLTDDQKKAAIRSATFKARNASNDYEFRRVISEETEKSTRVHTVEWHKKFTLSLACIFFFFIGAPLGAIIRRGGLGIPVVISVIIFIFYYIINVSGEKLAKSGEWIPWLGVWLSSMVLCPIGIFLTYKANKDSVLFNTEAYMSAIRKVLGLRVSRNIVRKEVIINEPDYVLAIQQLATLGEAWKSYAQRVRLLSPPNYLLLFFRNKTDDTVEKLNEEYEGLIKMLANSRDHALLGALNNLPVISAHAHTRPFHSYRWNLAIGIFLPAGLFFLFRIWRYRLRLYNDIQQILKNFTFIKKRIKTITENN